MQSLPHLISFRQSRALNPPHVRPHHDAIRPRVLANGNVTVSRAGVTVHLDEACPQPLRRVAARTVAVEVAVLITDTRGLVAPKSMSMERTETERDKAVPERHRPLLLLLKLLRGSDGRRVAGCLRLPLRLRAREGSLFSFGPRPRSLLGGEPLCSCCRFFCARAVCLLPSVRLLACENRPPLSISPRILSLLGHTPLRGGGAGLRLFGASAVFPRSPFVRLARDVFLPARSCTRPRSLLGGEFTCGRRCTSLSRGRARLKVCDAVQQALPFQLSQRAADLLRTACERLRASLRTLQSGESGE